MSTDRLPALAHPVPMSGSLAYHVAGNTVIDGVLIQPRGTPSAADISEASRRLGEAEWKCQPAEPLIIRDWFRGLAPHLPKAPKAEVETVVAGMLVACGELPRVCWTAETLKAALRAFEWWPSPARVYAFLEPVGEPFLRTRDALRRIANHHPEALPQRRQSPTEAELAEVTASMTTFMGERTWNQPDTVTPSAAVKPAPLTDAELLAVWERAFAASPTPCGTTRLAMLRSKLGIQTTPPPPPRPPAEETPYEEPFP